MNYFYSVEGDLRNNIGDVLQGMVAKPFLPSTATAVNREALSEMNNNIPGFLIANGWYMHSFEKFPPPQNITPLYVSIHIADSTLLKNKSIRDHFKDHAPIGCRDRKTLYLFLGWGIPAYYSGCLTITTKAKVSTGKENGDIILVDNVDHPVPGEVKNKLEKLLGKDIKRVSHDPPDVKENFKEYVENSTNHMEELLQRYCKASLVITTKIHCALPCLGMGANVMLIHPNPKDPRLDTVKEFMEIFSYKDILNTTKLKKPIVNYKKLNSRKLLLEEIISTSVEKGDNIVKFSNNYKLKNIKKFSYKKAKLYSLGISFLYAIGVQKKRIQRVYGL